MIDNETSTFNIFTNERKKKKEENFRQKATKPKDKGDKKTTKTNHKCGHRWTLISLISHTYAKADFFSSYSTRAKVGNIIINTNISTAKTAYKRGIEAPRTREKERKSPPFGSVL